VSSIGEIQQQYDSSAIVASDAACMAFTGLLYPETLFNSATVMDQTKSPAELQSAMINAFCRLQTADDASTLLSVLGPQISFLAGAFTFIPPALTAIAGMTTDTTTTIQTVCPVTCAPHFAASAPP